MNILYFTLDDFDSLIDYRSINTDLLREFQKHGHRVYVLSPSERKKGEATHVINENGATILKPKIGNIQKTNLIEKGISTVSIGTVLINSIKRYFSGVKFDLIMYCTPPITFLSAIEYVKNRDGARTYLLLKDIFPQNAVDIGMLPTEGIKSFLYKHFRSQEERLYAISDRIGCMSQANVDYVLKHNSDVRTRDNDSRRTSGRPIVEVCPNSIEVIDKSVDAEKRGLIRHKYGIPEDKTTLIYGGNLGKPQGISFMIECLKRCNALDNIFFLIVGNGTEAHLIREYVDHEKPQNVKYMNQLPRADYDNMVGACDVGLLFLDHRFTIPNFPSRMLSYMQAMIPILACTDPNTDVGETILDGGFGWWCESDDAARFENIVEEIIKMPDRDLQQMGNKAFTYLLRHYNSETSFNIINNHFRE